MNQIHRGAIETQDGGPGGCVQNVHIDNNQILSFVSPYWNSMGISGAVWCVVPGDTTSSVSGNTINLSPAGSTPPADGFYANYGIGIELGLPVMDGNTIQAMAGATGVAWFLSDFFTGSVPARISNNKICGPTPNAGWWQKDLSQGAVADPIMWNNTYTSSCGR
jgi:hypothetical protein